MPFAARRDDDGTWRLCKRKGATIRRATFVDQEVPIAFASQAKAKACADQLNIHWKPYERAMKKGEIPDQLAADMMDIIDDHKSP